jgi:hypothetical protein
VAKFVVPLACPPGRSRLLRAAWRPCSRGPARTGAWHLQAPTAEPRIGRLRRGLGEADQKGPMVYPRYIVPVDRSRRDAGFAVAA